MFPCLTPLDLLLVTDQISGNFGQRPMPSLLQQARPVSCWKCCLFLYSVDHFAGAKTMLRALHPPPLNTL